MILIRHWRNPIRKNMVKLVRENDDEEVNEDRYIELWSYKIG